MLTHNEKMLLADALNGCGLLLQADPSWLQMMTGESYNSQDFNAQTAQALLGTYERILKTGFASGLEHEIWDAININMLDQKWNVDGPGLIDKLYRLTWSEREMLIRAVVEFWDSPDSWRSGSRSRPQQPDDFVSILDKLEL